MTGGGAAALRTAGPPLRVEALSGVLGAEVRGVDLHLPLDDAAAAALRDAWHEYAVLVVRGQSLTEDEQARYGEYFGPLGDARYAPTRQGEAVPHHAAVLFISNIREHGRLIGTLPDGEVHFHTDMHFTPNPPVATMLYAIEIPSRGGNTRFANMYAAYDALPDAVKQRLDGLRALNVYDLYSAAGAPAKRISAPAPDAPSCIHPVVRAHPVTGRKVVNVNRLMTAKIEDLGPAESDDLLTYLFDHIEQERFVYEHVWRQGDLVLWDNRCTQHARTDFDASERRLLRRMTVQSERAG
jgi:taurine dioxygenase